MSRRAELMIRTRALLEEIKADQKHDPADDLHVRLCRGCERVRVDYHIKKIDALGPAVTEAHCQGLG